MARKGTGHEQAIRDPDAEAFPNFLLGGAVAEGFLDLLHGLASCSEWTGVLLSTLLEETGIDPKAKWMIAEEIGLNEHLEANGIEPVDIFGRERGDLFFRFVMFEGSRFKRAGGNISPRDRGAEGEVRELVVQGRAEVDRLGAALERSGGTAPSTGPQMVPLPPKSAITIMVIVVMRGNTLVGSM